MVPKLKDVVGVTICDFCLWDEPGEDDEAAVPMLSRWRMQEQHSSRPGLPQVQYVFLELPKYQGGEHPEGREMPIEIASGFACLLRSRNLETHSEHPEQM